jgi:hypothetical protein
MATSNGSQSRATSRRSSQRRHNDQELLFLAREIALAAAPENPSAITQTIFNRARLRSQPDCPEAAYIARRLQCSWSEVLRIAFSYEGNTFKLLAQRKGITEADRATCVEALRLVAERLQLPTLRPDDYEKEREAIIGKRRGTHRASLLKRLPKAAMIDYHGWDELLLEAGLSSRSRRKNRQGMPIPDAVELFLQTQGRLPSLRDLIKFSKEHGFSVQEHKEIKPHTQVLRERREKQGLWTPSRVPKPSQRPPWQITKASASTAQAFPLARRNYWTLELVREGLQLALKELEPGERLTLPVLRRLAKGNRDIPTASVVGQVAKKHGTTITALRAEALLAMRPPHTPLSEAAE